MHSGLDLTKRQREVVERLEQGMSVKRISADMGISRNAVYQHVERLRQRGVLPDEYTPSGQPPRTMPKPAAGLELGAAVPAPGFSGGGPGVTVAGSVLGEMRSADRGDESAYARRIEGAIASGDVAALSYELGRLDAVGERTVISGMIESALERHKVIGSD
jgi:hypothetical protein